MAFNKHLIKYPVVSEKATQMTALNKYLFVVTDDATAPEVKKAIEGLHKVKVAKVNMINTRPKPKNFGRFPHKIAGFRKAIVTLKAGQKMDIMPK